MKKIIAFCGVKQSGKDTAFNALKENFKDIIDIEKLSTQIYNIYVGGIAT